MASSDRTGLDCAAGGEAVGAAVTCAGVARVDIESSVPGAAVTDFGPSLGDSDFGFVFPFSSLGPSSGNPGAFFRVSSVDGAARFGFLPSRSDPRLPKTVIGRSALRRAGGVVVAAKAAFTSLAG